MIMSNKCWKIHAIISEIFGKIDYPNLDFKIIPLLIIKDNIINNFKYF